MRNSTRKRTPQSAAALLLLMAMATAFPAIAQDRQFGVKPQYSRFSKDSPRYRTRPVSDRQTLNAATGVKGQTNRSATPKRVPSPPTIGHDNSANGYRTDSNWSNRSSRPDESPLYPPHERIESETQTREISRQSHELPRTAPLPDSDPSRTANESEAQKAWWDRAIKSHALQPAGAVPVSLESLITSALQNSAQIQVYQELPLIREMSIMEADAAFDWTSFVESRWNDINEPVGNLLTTNEDRYSDHNISTSFGVRRKNTLGGQFEVAQRLGYQNTNSQFFIPHNQATSRLTLGYTQPLLRGRGRLYNTSLTVLAKIDQDVSEHEFSKQLQGHLLEITRAYWGLYRERGNLLQRRRLYDRARKIHDALTQRADIDALKPQLVRSRSAVEARRADILRAETDVRIAEGRIRALVNDPALGRFNSAELLPQDTPFSEFMPIDIASSVEQAIQNRPEINQAMLQIRSAGVRFNMSKNELLPSLNLILETYTSGLRGNSNLQNSITDQYTEGQPSYSVGLQYEFPIWNRASQARYQRRRLELRQMESQFRTALENLNLEVEIAVRELTTSYREVDAKYRAMDAAHEEVDYRKSRWELLPGDDRSASLMLEDLLDAQERLTAAEFEFLEAQTGYSLSQMTYKRAIGTLLIAENITADQFCECYLPRTQLRRSEVQLIAPQDASAEGDTNK